MALSASAVVDDGALLIDGDDGNNSINVSILGDAVTVSLDGAAPQTFTGLGSAFKDVKIDAQGGDDSVTVDASGVAAGAGQDLKLAIDGGDGNDAIDVKLANTQVSQGAAQPTAGDEQDDEDEEEDSSLPGSGNDDAENCRRGSEGHEDEDGDDSDVQGAGGEHEDDDKRGGRDERKDEDDDDERDDSKLELRVDGGDGNDTVNVNVQGLTVHEDGEFKARLDGDDGNDVFSVVADDVLIDGKASLKGEGGEGDDSLSLTATDVSGELELKIDVETFTTGSVNQPATFGGDTTGSGAEDGGPITGALTVSDPVDGISTPNFTVSVAAANGTATIDSTSGAWSYTPAADFNGADSFTVSATDDKGNTETQVISITVTQVNDPATFAGDTSGTGAEDGGPIAGALTVADAADGMTAPNFTVSVAATNGTATIDSGSGAWSYTPAADFNGSDSFTVSVTDDDGNTETQVVSITVTQVNDPATFGGDTSGTGAEDGGPITGTLTVSDAADGVSVPNFTVLVAAISGTATIDSSTGAWSYTPAANFNGSDSFTVSATDDDGNVETQVIGITVTQVNDPASFAGDITGSGAQGGGPITGLLSVTDTADGMTAPNFTVSVAATNGTATIDGITGAWSYAAAAGFTGSDSFTVSATDDDGNTETQVIGITVT